ncbi:MAG TPA: hypothetical protein PKO41_01865 [Dokdonella sp.]|uniref:hypothetical protein n=1 Tax=Dokdonella sp. TaxID=2291710 RepID=UPI0025BC1E52|nr:hypothetical protein [Dokdonella sp.]MBX3691385.1 hypothetical protein [Dokdonella sp.]MCW5566747.1 hypothetical protein [Dokdonella sp.]HNR91148.1 hypothetical protein [Dokdonella sp.]
MPVSSSFSAAAHAFSHVTALLAIECAGPCAPAHPLLGRDDAERLIGMLATDLARHAGGAAQLDLVAVGALYDQAQLLRPRWPLYAALADALDRLPAAHDTGRIIALGAHQGRPPAPALAPEASLYGSPLLVLPWLLAGPPATVADVGRQLELELLEHGLADAALSLAVGEAFGIEVTHARHLTTFDLCAMACSQYQHAGLGALWQIIEVALLSPEREETVALDANETLAWRGGRAHLRSSDRTRRAQCRAILAAHGIALDIDGAAFSA